MTRPTGPEPYSAGEIAYRLRSELWYAADLHANVKPPIKNLSKDEATFVMTFSGGHRVRVTINQLPPETPVPAGEQSS